MSDQDENVYGPSALNGPLSVKLAELGASDRSNILHALLADKNFYDDVNEFAEKLSLSRPGKRAHPESLDLHIQDQVLKQNLIQAKPDADEFTRDLAAIRWFNRNLSQLLAKHHVPAKYRVLIKEYMVLGDVNHHTYMDEVSISINPETNKLIIELEATATRREFEQLLPRIFAYWDTRRGKTQKPKHFNAKSAAKWSRMKSDASYGEIANESGEDIASVKKRIERIRKRRADLLGDTI